MIQLLAEVGIGSVFILSREFSIIGFAEEGLNGQIRSFAAETAWSSLLPSERQKNLESDLTSRDFTINSIAFALPQGEYSDPNNGRRDLELGIIRFVGDPGKTIENDPIRMVRAARFVNELGFRLEPTSASAIEQHASRISNVSKERIGKEVEKILVSEHPSNAFRILDELKLLDKLFPALSRMKGLPQGRNHDKDAFEHVMAVTDGLPAIRHLRWAGLLHDIGKPLTFESNESGIHFFGHESVGARIAQEILTDYKVPNVTAASIVKLIEMHLRPLGYNPDWADGAVKRLVSDAGELLDDLLILSRADVLAQAPSVIA